MATWAVYVSIFEQLSSLHGATLLLPISLRVAPASQEENLMANIGDYRAVGSPAPDTGRYQHSACTRSEIFAKGNILTLCSSRSCPNKGANWVLQEITATVAV